MTWHDAAGGSSGLLKMAEAWHRHVLADEIVSNAFQSCVDTDHVERLAACWGRSGRAGGIFGCSWSRALCRALAQREWRAS
jgi:hypothetical protein